MKKLYSLIGWEDDDASGGGKIHKYAFGMFVPNDDAQPFSVCDFFSPTFVDAPPSPCKAIHPEIQGCHSQAPTGPTSLLDSHLNRDNDGCRSALWQPVVVLTRLSASEIRALCQPKSSKHRKENEFSWVSNSDEQRESEDDEGTPSNKRRKTDGRSHTKPKDSAREAVKTKIQQAQPSGNVHKQ